MSKFLYFQDGHAKGKNSINRIGDYQADWLVKFDELICIAKENKVKGIIDGGDLFDSPIVSYKVCDAIIDRIEKAELQYYCLFGNHAERYHSKEHSYDTTLAHILRRSRNFKYLPDSTGFAGNNSIIKGFEYSHNIEDTIKNKGIIFDKKYEKLNSWKVAIVHAFVCPKSFPYASHVVCNDIKTNADLVLVAHYHAQWEKKVGNTQYLDIGCFGRNSITEANIEPSCIILDTDKRSYEMIKLKSAKKGEDCFDFSKIQNEEHLEASLNEFIQALESTNFQGLRLENILDQLQQAGKTEKEIIEIIKNKIEVIKNES